MLPMSTALMSTALMLKTVMWLFRGNDVHLVLTLGSPEICPISPAPVWTVTRNMTEPGRR